MLAFSTIITSILRIVYLLTVDLSDLTCKSYPIPSLYTVHTKRFQTLSPPQACGPMWR